MKKCTTPILLIIIIGLFFSFGLFHLTKFETTDEHFWKYDRIEKYWNGWREGLNTRETFKWKKTRINDKPGVTVALISGVGLLSEPEPDTHQVTDPEKLDTKVYVGYDIDRTESINFSQRFPILLFNTLFLLYLFWILNKLLKNNTTLALLTLSATAFTPAIIGISQVTNPDSLLWNFSAAAMFTYITLIQTNQRRYLWLTILFTGLALLSKYTANILFLLYVFIFLSHLCISYTDILKTTSVKKYILQHIRYVILLITGSALIYSILMPAVFINARYLWEGTIGSVAFKPLLIPFAAFLTLLTLDALLLKSFLLNKAVSFFHTYQQFIIRSTVGITLFFILFVLINPHLHEPILPLKDIRETVFEGGEMIFPMFVQDALLIRFIKSLAVEFQAFTFSLLPIVLITLLLFWCKVIFFGIKNNKLLIFFLSAFPLIYFTGLLAAGVLGNPRYSIMLYTPTALLFTLALYDLFLFARARNWTNLKKIRLTTYIITLLFIATALPSLFHIKPHYLNYESFFLPKKYSVMDGWGYGSYEAALYLNSLPDAENIIIWSDRNLTCQFFVGKCLKKYKIDLEIKKPDYVVISRRNAIRHRFKWSNGHLTQYGASHYYSVKPQWQLSIGDRDANYIKVVKIDR